MKSIKTIVLALTLLAPACAQAMGLAETQALADTVSVSDMVPGFASAVNGLSHFSVQPQPGLLSRAYSTLCSAGSVALEKVKATGSTALQAVKTNRYAQAALAACVTYGLYKTYKALTKKKPGQTGYVQAPRHPKKDARARNVAIAGTVALGTAGGAYAYRDSIATAATNAAGAVKSAAGRVVPLAQQSAQAVKTAVAPYVTKRNTAVAVGLAMAGLAYNYWKNRKHATPLIATSSSTNDYRGMFTPGS